MWENRNNEGVPEKRGGAGQSLRGRGRERRAGSGWNRLEQRTENIKDKGGVLQEGKEWDECLVTTYCCQVLVQGFCGHCLIFPAAW